MRLEEIGLQPVESEGPEGSFFTAEKTSPHVLTKSVPALLNGQYIEVGGVYLAYAVRYETPARRKVKDTKVVLFTPHEMEVAEEMHEGIEYHLPYARGAERKATRLYVNSKRRVITAGGVIFDMQRQNVSRGRKDLSLVLGYRDPQLSPGISSYHRLDDLTERLVGSSL